MNLFVTDKNPIIAARNLCDKHVVKMAIENLQLLSNCFPQDVAPYKHTHYNHPAAIFVRSSLQNFEWALAHGLAICDEYTARYCKTHACEKYYYWISDRYNNLNLPDIGLTEFAQCYGEYKDQCYTENDPVTGYRKYYIIAKSKFAKWKLGNIPQWYSEGVKEHAKQV